MSHWQMFRELDQASDEAFHELQWYTADQLADPAVFQRVAGRCVYSFDGSTVSPYPHQASGNAGETFTEPVLWRHLMPKVRPLVDTELQRHRPEYFALLMDVNAILHEVTGNAFTFASCDAKPTQAVKVISKYLTAFNTTSLLFSPRLSTSSPVSDRRGDVRPLLVEWSLRGDHSSLFDGADTKQTSVHRLSFAGNPSTKRGLKWLNRTTICDPFSAAITDLLDALNTSQRRTLALEQRYASTIAGYRRHICHKTGFLPLSLCGLFVPSKAGGRPLGALFLLFDTGDWRPRDWPYIYAAAVRLARFVADITHRWQTLKLENSKAKMDSAHDMLEWLNHETGHFKADLTSASMSLRNALQGEPRLEAACDAVDAIGYLMRSTVQVGRQEVGLGSDPVRRDELVSVIKKVLRYYEGFRVLTLSTHVEIPASPEGFSPYVLAAVVELIRNAVRYRQNNVLSIDVVVRNERHATAVSVVSGPQKQVEIDRLRNAFGGMQNSHGWSTLRRWADRNDGQPALRILDGSKVAVDLRFPRTVR